MAALFLSACDRPQPAPEEPPVTVPEAEAPVSTPVAAEPEAAPEPVNTSAQVAVLGYHRFENPPRDPLAISTAEFEQQLQALKDGGITVITMQDFLAWRRGEKSIPEKSAVITIDDGYRSAYDVAWPSLKKFGYPFTMFVYTKYVNVGGKSLTWDQLREMHAAGVEIGSHSTSHANLNQRKGRDDAAYRAFLEEELAESKRVIEEHMGAPVLTFAYPYGNHNELAREVGRAAGYEALFTVAGHKVGHASPADALGRYIIQTGHPMIFRAAATFGTGAAPATGVAAAPAPAAAPQVNGINTQPADGAVVTSDRPVISAHLGPFARTLQPDSLEMHVSGIGLVPVNYDPSTQTATARLRGKLRDREITVTLSGGGSGRRFQTSWSFRIDPDAAQAAENPTEMAAMAVPEETGGASMQ